MSSRIRRNEKVTKARKKDRSQDDNRVPKKNTPRHSSDMLQTVNTIDAEANEIDTIRDIIFGRQMANYEDRFAQLEERINAQIAAMREQMTHRLEETEKLIKEQKDRLTERLNDEQSERKAEAERLSSGIVVAQKGLSTDIDALADRQVQDIQTIGEQLTALSSDLSDEIHIQHVEISKKIEQAVQELDNEKLARKALSQLLMEMAGRLTDKQQ